jgi:hypothetical protein
MFTYKLSPFLRIKTNFTVFLQVSPSLTQHERAAYIKAANVAGLNVLALVNEGTGGKFLNHFTD